MFELNRYNFKILIKLGTKLTTTIVLIFQIYLHVFIGVNYTAIYNYKTEYFYEISIPLI